MRTAWWILEGLKVNNFYLEVKDVKIGNISLQIVRISTPKATSVERKLRKYSHNEKKHLFLLLTIILGTPVVARTDCSQRNYWQLMRDQRRLSIISPRQCLHNDWHYSSSVNIHALFVSHSLSSHDVQMRWTLWRHKKTKRQCRCASTWHRESPPDPVACTRCRWCVGHADRCGSPAGAPPTYDPSPFPDIRSSWRPTARRGGRAGRPWRAPRSAEPRTTS